MPSTPDKKINILYVFGGEKAQGAEIVIERLMSDNAHLVNTHLILSPGKFASNLLNSNKPYKITLLNDLKKLNRSNTSKFQYYKNGLRNYITVSYKVYRYVRSHNIDMVHANTIVPASYLIPLIIYAQLFLRNIKWFWSDHDLKYFSKLDSIISQLCSRLYDRTLVVSEAVKSKYKNSDNITVLYNGLDTAYFKPDANKRNVFRAKVVKDESMILIGMAASITPDKGQLNLIKAFQNLSSSFNNVMLILAGGFATDTPDYSEKVRSAIAQDDKIVYLGFIDNITEFYNGCDIIVNNSNQLRSESLGTTIYEAMACEKVVIASDTGGTPEIIADKVDGFLFQTDNVDDLQSTLLSVITNYSALDQVRSAAREKVKVKFNIKTMISNYNNIITPHK
jgi:glycosyltransferase involved in cell wall biosynthesis